MAYGTLADAEYENSVQDLQDAVTEMEEQIMELQAELTELNTQLSEYQADLEVEKRCWKRRICGKHHGYGVGCLWLDYG